jgi:pilus assembly protein CpaE
VARVMVIDDDDELLKLVSLILERGGHEPLLVDDPYQAMARLIEEEPDLLILDVMMPGVSGHEIARLIRATAAISHLPIVVLSARAQAVDRQAALESGADDYLAKPVVPQTLWETIDQLLSRPPTQPGGLVVTLFGLRGGSGRTTLAVNLAAALAGLGDEEVALVDLAPGGSQPALQLRLQPDDNWSALPGGMSLSWDSLRGLMLAHSSGLRLLAAPREPQAPHLPARETTMAVLDLLRQKMRFIIVDTPPLLTAAVLTALERSDLIIHVVRPEVISVQIAVHSNRALHSQQVPPAKVVHLLNQTAPEPQLPADAVSRALRAPLPFVTSYDAQQSRALAQDVPLVLTPGSGPLPTSIRSIATALSERFRAGATPAASST